jgi:hypothetical protein
MKRSGEKMFKPEDLFDDAAWLIVAVVACFLMACFEFGFLPAALITAGLCLMLIGGLLYDKRGKP